MRLTNTSGSVCCLLAVLLAGCNVTIGPSLRGSGVAKTETREVAPFSEIEVGSAIQLDVVVGDPTDLVVTADDNVLPLVRTEVTGDRLKIYLDTSLSTNIGVQVKAATPELKALVASGASKVNATGITGEKFQIELHGSSTGEFGSEAEVMDITLSGASHAVLAGVGSQLNLECFGASRINAAGFTADKVTAVVSGASFAQVNAKEEFAADASGASHIHYTGQPAKLKKQVSGASTVTAQ
jgi:hypothetical protein